MIPKLKQRSFNYQFPLLIGLLVPLVGFFVYASLVQVRFFAVLSLVSLISIVILFVFYRRLKSKQAEVKLQREEYFEKTNLLKADLDKESQAISAFREKIVSYSQLRNLLEEISMCLTFEDTVHTLCKEVAALFDYKDSTVILYLLDHESGELRLAHAAAGHRVSHIKVKGSDLFDRWVLKSLQPLHLSDALNDYRFAVDKSLLDTARPVRSLISAPLVVHNKPIGIMRLDSPSLGRFTEEDLRFLKTIGDVAAVAIENAQLYDRVEDLAIRDSLTGLFLRRYLMERMAEEISRHHQHKKTLAFVMLDLDYFKKYNDRFGHPAGDILLKTVADMLRRHFNQPGDLVCRYGGEEFCVLISDCSRKEAASRAAQFVRMVEKQEIVLRREKTGITVSAGVAMFPANAAGREELVMKADEALYEAKNKGRNQVCLSP